jgi:hypothetical protein
VSDLEGAGVLAGEGQFLQDVYPTQQDGGGVDRFAYSSTMHLTESSTLVGDASRQALWDAWSPYWDTDRRYLLEKTPSNLLKMRFLQALYPESSFVVMIRHPIAQAIALRARGWSDRSVSRLVDHWVTAHEIMSGDIPGLRRVTVIRYEDLVAEPVGGLQGIQSFLDLPPKPIELDLDRGLNHTYFDRWKGSGLASVTARLTARRFESRIARYGYSFASPLPVGPLPSDLPTLDGFPTADATRQRPAS